jgi:UDP-N-acetylglucosamine diphosphorylase/glucosamine-1-phosphate N-acetyltransferase
MQLCFFEDERSSNFLPLTLTRPMDDLRVGILTIREKWEAKIKPERVLRVVPEYLSSLFPAGEVLSNTDCLWINSRFLPDVELIQTLRRLQPGEGIASHETTIAFKVSADRTSELLQNFQQPPTDFKLTPYDKPVTVLSYLWDLLQINAQQIESDLPHFNYQTLLDSKFATVCISTKPNQIFVAEDATIEPGCTLIADDGPIFIGAKAVIQSGSILRGPVAICEKAVVHMGARIFNGTTIGPVCKVGGEINNCVLHSYSNKAHDGFLGNSVIGQWCNFGADSNTSNLKNNYSLVFLTDWKTGKRTMEGVQFFGTAMADFSKTAINTSLNTGTICGVSSNIFCSGFPPKKISSFQWRGDDAPQIYQLDKALVAMKAMMARRNVPLTEAYETMIRFLFDAEVSA